MCSSSVLFEKFSRRRTNNMVNERFWKHLVDVLEKKMLATIKMGEVMGEDIAILS